MCAVEPPSSLNLPHHAALGLPLQPKAELLWLQRRQKNRRGGVEREREGVNMQRMRGGTAQVGSFTDRWIIIDHTLRVIKSIIEPSCVYFGPCESFKREPKSCAGPKSFSWHDRKKGGDHLLTKTMANFSSSSVGSGMGTFRGMMWCFISDWPSTLSMFPIFNFKEKKNLHNPPTFFFLNWKIQTPK